LFTTDIDKTSATMRKGNSKLLIRNLRKMSEQKEQAQALDLSNVMQWVAIEDKLPPIEVDVLVWYEFNVYICNRLDEDGVVWDESTQILDGVTHWMHLPEPPCA